jgi:DNA-binding transcriptional MocR family regulator
VVSSFIEPGDVVVADRLTYYGLKALAQMFRFGIVGLGSDGEGLAAGELDDACKKQRIKAVFTVPTFQNPTVVTMSAERRAEIAEIARRHDLIVIEDDVYGPMPSKRAAAIATLCPERTFHISSLSKALAPGLRVGFLLSPPGRATITAEAIRGTSWMPAPLSVLVATRWIEDGTARRILDAQVAELGARNRVTSEMLAGLDFNADPACMFIWLRLPAPWHAQDFAANARAHGVGVMPAAAFAVDHQATEQSVRINLGCAASRQELTEALRIVAATLRDRPRALFTTI